MVEIRASEDLCWLIGATMEEYKNKEGKFSIDDAVRLMQKKKDLFVDAQ
jgi:hypothetical protein